MTEYQSSTSSQSIGEHQPPSEANNFSREYIEGLDEQISHHLEVHKNEPFESMWQQIDANILGQLPDYVSRKVMSVDEAEDILQAYKEKTGREVTFENIVALQQRTSTEFVQKTMRSNFNAYLKRFGNQNRAGQIILDDINSYHKDGLIDDAGRKKLIVQLEFMMEEGSLKSETHETDDLDRNDGG